MTIEEYHEEVYKEKRTTKRFYPIRLFLILLSFILIIFWILFGVFFLLVSTLFLGLYLILTAASLFIILFSKEHREGYVEIYRLYKHSINSIIKGTQNEIRRISFVFSSSKDFKSFIKRIEDIKDLKKQERIEIKQDKKEKIEKERKETKIGSQKLRKKPLQKKEEFSEIKGTKSQEIKQYLERRKGEKLNIFDLVDQLNTPLAEIEEQLQRLFASDIIKGTYDEKTGEILVE